EGPFRVEGRFDPHVAVAWLTPGQDGSALRSLADGETRAVMLVAFGAGNVPVEDRGVADAIEALVERGVVVAIGSQAPHGRVDLEAYAGGRLAKDMGAVGIRDMTLEAATVKLMYLLGTLDDPAEVRRRLAEPIAGEVGVPS
ncbi:MAG: asparaginase, partial [Actinobacteria bacterium]|nr:asparaginase [Actinomycetota bacterium]NIU67482.1 asparaginase [Actinomycetota bacterium]